MSVSNVTLLDDSSSAHDNDQIGLADRGKPVRNDERGAAGSQFPETFHNESLGFGVDRRSGLIQNQNGSIEENGAGDSKSLLFSFRQCRSLLTDDRVVTLRKPSQ